MPSAHGVAQLDGIDTFYDWYRSIKLHARHTGCHRTLEGHFAEPARRLPPAGSAPGRKEYDSIRPPNEHAGDKPPGVGQCKYLLHANFIEAGSYDDAMGIAKEDVDEWRYWAAMEAKSQALILGTVSIVIEAEVADQWCANDMFTALCNKYGCQPSFENLRLSESINSPSVAKHMVQHLAEWNNRLSLAKTFNSGYKPGAEMADLFMKSLHLTVKHAMLGEWHRVPYALRTFDAVVVIFQKFIDAASQNSLEVASSSRSHSSGASPVSLDFRSARQL